MAERYERTKPAVVTVEPLPGRRIGNTHKATVRLEMLGEMWFLTVRPWRMRRVYRMALPFAAEMVCDVVAKAEADKTAPGIKKFLRSTALGPSVI